MISRAIAAFLAPRPTTPARPRYRAEGAAVIDSRTGLFALFGSRSRARMVATDLNRTHSLIEADGLVWLDPKKLAHDR